MPLALLLLQVQQLLAFVDFKPDTIGQPMTLQQLFHVIVLLKRRRADPAASPAPTSPSSDDAAPVAPVAVVPPTAVLPADILKNVCADFNIDIDIECLIKNRDADGNGVVEYQVRVVRSNRGLLWLLLLLMLLLSLLLLLLPLLLLLLLLLFCCCCWC